MVLDVMCGAAGWPPAVIGTIQVVPKVMCGAAAQRAASHTRRSAHARLFMRGYRLPDMVNGSI